MNKARKYAELVAFIAAYTGEERASKCGYDLLRGIEKGNAEDRYQAWICYIKEIKNKEGHTDTERDGVWVPAIPVKT